MLLSLSLLIILIFFGGILRELSWVEAAENLLNPPICYKLSFLDL